MHWVGETPDYSVIMKRDLKTDRVATGRGLCWDKIRLDMALYRNLFCRQLPAHFPSEKFIHSGSEFTGYREIRFINVKFIPYPSKFIHFFLEDHQ